MVWKPTLLFFSLLTLLHVVEPALIPEPLSMSRDGKYPALGYAAFAALLWGCCQHVRVYIRAPRSEQGNTMGPLVAAVLLLIVAITPTFNAIHVCSSCFLIVWVFVFFAAKLYTENSLWLFAYLAVPIGISAAILALGLTYGIWQKAIIVYYLAVMNLDSWSMLGIVSRK
jgi:hypothetical protein